MLDVGLVYCDRPLVRSQGFFVHPDGTLVRADLALMRRPTPLVRRILGLLLGLGQTHARALGSLGFEPNPLLGLRRPQASALQRLIHAGG
jgi:hypothetical protein